MSASPSRLLVLLLLSILIAAPLSAGDKGIWLSLTSASTRLLHVPANRFGVEHSTLVPKHFSVAVAAVRGERADSTKGIAALTVLAAGSPAMRWTTADRVEPHGHRKPAISAAVASRGPPHARCGTLCVL